MAEAAVKEAGDGEDIVGAEAIRIDNETRLDLGLDDRNDRSVLCI